MGITQEMRKRVGVVQGGIHIRGPIAQKLFLDIGHIVQNSILVSHFPLKIAVKIRDLRIIGIRGRGLSKTTHNENFKNPNFLLLMVR